MTINNILDNWLNDTQTALFDNYIKLGLKASGKWGKSLEQFKDSKNSVFTAGIWGEDYTEYLENGRRPNKSAEGWTIGSKKPMPEGLRKWIGWAGNTFLKKWVEDKGLKISPFAVAVKVGSEGWKVPNKFNDGGLVSDVINKERINELNKSLSLFFVSELRSELRKIGKKI